MELRASRAPLRSMVSSSKSIRSIFSRICCIGVLGTEGSHIGTDVTVSFGSNLLEIDVVGELHVLGVNAEISSRPVGLGYRCRLHDRNDRNDGEQGQSSVGRLVAAMTTMLERALRPSMSVIAAKRHVARLHR